MDSNTPINPLETSNAGENNYPSTPLNYLPVNQPTFQSPRMAKKVWWIVGGLLVFTILIISLVGLLMIGWFNDIKGKPLLESLPSTIPTPSLPVISQQGDTANVDTDQDGLPADQERIYGTDPAKSDTDGDGYSDGEEVKAGYDPLGPSRLNAESTFSPLPTTLHDSGVALSNDFLTIILPAKYTNLPNSSSDILDKNGCVPGISDPPGFICSKKDLTDGSVRFELLITDQIAPVSDDFFLQNLSSLIKEDREATVTDVTQLFFGYKGFIATYEINIDGQQVLKRDTYFMKDSKLYIFNFVASNESTFNDLWPEIELAIKNIKFK